MVLKNQLNEILTLNVFFGQIELDIDPEDKVINSHLSISHDFSFHLLYISFSSDHTHKGESRGAIGCATTTAAADFFWSTNVRYWSLIYLSAILIKLKTFTFFLTCRADDKIAKDLGIQAGAVLHLVLALRGGGSVQSYRE